MRTCIIAIASPGGHWVQLRRLDPAFLGLDVVYISTGPRPIDLPEDKYIEVADFSRQTPFRGLLCLLQMIGIFARCKPRVVITTGAAPGLIGLVVGRIFLARTVWIDSVANGEQLSGSGMMARRIAHICLSQWRNVAESCGVKYWGSVL